MVIIMINKNILDYVKKRWLSSEYHEPISVISASASDRKTSLVNISTKIFNFDKITKTIYGEECDVLPASADGMFFIGNKLYFVEFKTGFKKKITKENFDKKIGICKYKKEICEGYWDLFFKNQKKETNELKYSIKTKAIDSFVTLDKMLIPRCDEGDKVSICFMAVIDADSGDALLDMYEKGNKNSGDIKRIRDSLKQYNKYSNKLDYFYDEIEVKSEMEFERFIHQHSKELQLV